MSERARRLFLGGAIFVAVAYVVTRIALVLRFPPFVDEALYARWAWLGLEDPGARFISLANGKEPLLPWIGTVFMWLGLEPLTAVRLVSVVAGAVTLACLTLIALEFGGRLVALAAAAVYVILPFVFVHDAIGIYDPLATAAVTAALLLELRLVRGGGVVPAALLGVAFGVGLLTKQTTYLSFALAPVVLLLLPQGPERVRLFGRWLAANGAALAIGLAAYSVLRFSEHYDDLGRLRDAIYPTHSLGDALGSPRFWLEHNWPLYQDALVGYLTLPIVFLIGVGATVAFRRSPRHAAILIVWGLAPILAALLLADEPFPRYLLTGLPMLVVLAGYGGVVTLEGAGSRIPRGAAAVALAALAVAAATPALVFDARVLARPETTTYPGLDDHQYATGPASGGPWPKVADVLRDRASGEPTTIVMGEQGSEALTLLLRDEPEQQVVREPDGWTRFGVENGVPLQDPPGAVTWREAARFERPRGGVPLVLLERGVVAEGSFFASPDELREGLGLDDAGFDAYLAANPDVAQWYQAWYAART